MEMYPGSSFKVDLVSESHLFQFVIPPATASRPTYFCSEYSTVCQVTLERNAYEAYRSFLEKGELVTAVGGVFRKWVCSIIEVVNVKIKATTFL
jgi:hypothetical protein